VRFLTPARWYASRAAMERDEPSVALIRRRSLNILSLSAVRSRGPVAFPSWDADTLFINVTGRSPAHIDRLARDWIGHGVGPTWSGGRGVGACPMPDRSAVGGTSRRFLPDWATWEKLESAQLAYLRAEARASRVVRR
jgi:hypothetical protein